MDDEYLPEPEGGCSVRLEYHLRKNFVVYFLKLANASLADYNTLSFDIKADAAIGIPNKIKIELKRAKNAEVAAVSVSGITAKWQTIRLPFTSFQPTPLSSYKDMSELVFTFELDEAGQAGVVYLDNITALVR